MRRKIFLFSVLMTLSVVSLMGADAVKFTAIGPSTVVVDKPFQLVYTVNASCKDLRAPEMNNFDVLAGPFESHSQSIQMINGKTTSSLAVSYTYTLQAQKVGTFTIPSASITVEGQKYMSNGLSIKVLPADNSSSKAQQGNQSNAGAGNSAASQASNIPSENIFIKTNVSKTNVYEQEAILVTYKLYTLMDVVQCGNKKMPDFNGFLKQDIDQPQNKQFAYENFNGKNYGTVVLYQVLLYPQHAGVIEVSKATFEALIRVQNRANVKSIFDDFFDTYTNVTRNVIAPSVKVTVNPLPANKPASFSGTVGHFTMSPSISADQVKANDAITIKINISGTGNMKLIKTPVIKFPDGFETYDPKVSNNFKTTTSGVTGSKNIEYMVIPRHSGDFEIPSSEFSYFDIQDKAYKTLRTPTYKVKVQKGEGGENNAVVGTYVSKEDVKQLGKDIRYIHSDEVVLKKEETALFGTFISWLFYLVPLLLSGLLFVFFRKQAKENSDLSLVKNKKANKIAQKRLKLAQKLLQEGKKDLFYEEVLKALWAYLSDKLGISLSNLTKEHVQSELYSKGVDETIYSRILEILNTCEFARYAPTADQRDMGNLYDDTIKVISELENLIKK
jgi:BatD DUF11 like domain